MEKQKYSVYIDRRWWGNFTSTKNKKDFREEMQENLKKLHPINMSEEGAIEYRKRFENSKIFVFDHDDYEEKKQPAGKYE